MSTTSAEDETFLVVQPAHTAQPTTSAEKRVAYNFFISLFFCIRIRFQYIYHLRFNLRRAFTIALTSVLYKEIEFPLLLPQFRVMGRFPGIYGKIRQVGDYPLTIGNISSMRH